MKTVLVVGCGFPQLGLVRTARRLGLRVVGADRDPDAVAVAECDAFAAASTDDPDALRAALARHGATAIATAGSEVGLRSAAEVAARAGLPFWVTPDGARRATDKAAMRASGETAAALCPDLDAAAAFAASVGYPLVVKPAAGWGQRGVRRVDDPSELAAAFVAAGAADAGAVLVEAWLVGREFSVNGWLDGGELEALCVTERLVFPGRAPLGVMRSEVHPGGLPDGARAAVVACAHRVAVALGLRDGPCYAQVVYSPEHGARLVETTPRTGGGFDPEVTRLASGVDLYERLLGVVCDVAEWRRAGPSETTHPAALVEFATAPPGRLRAVHGLDAARALPGVHAVHVFVRPGERVRPLENGACRPGCVLVTGPDRATATATAAAALDAIRLEVEP